MRVRFTRSIGLPVLDEETGDMPGLLNGILIHPDTGAIEGVFVRSPGFLPGEDLFLQSADILHWGTRITVRRADVLAPVEDIVRLRALLDGHRPVIGQRMVTTGGTVLGSCRDVQFNTKDFRLEWLFPKRFFRWGTPVPGSQILEVRPEAIILRDTTRPEKANNLADPLSLMTSLPEAT